MHLETSCRVGVAPAKQGFLLPGILSNVAAAGARPGGAAWGGPRALLPLRTGGESWHQPQLCEREYAGPGRRVRTQGNVGPSGSAPPADFRCGNCGLTGCLGGKCPGLVL